jgi:hypothetical protein
MYFLATPHRGADSAQFARLVRHPAVYGSKAFVDDLLPGSGTLDVCYVICMLIRGQRRR